MDKDHHPSQNVVTMSEYRPETGYVALAQVEAYWEALRGTRLLPKRSDLDPRGIEQALEYTFIIERVALGVGRLRIAGGHLNDLMGMEVRGMPLTSLFSPAARKGLTEVLEDVFQTPSVARLTLASAAAPLRPSLQARMVLLPLQSDLGDVSRIMGCLVAQGEIGEAPRRFDLGTKQIRPLLLDRDLPLPPRPVVKPDQSKGFAETKTPFEKTGTSRHPPYLRLVKSEE